MFTSDDKVLIFALQVNDFVYLGSLIHLST